MFSFGIMSTIDCSHFHFYYALEFSFTEFLLEILNVLPDSYYPHFSNQAAELKIYKEKDLCHPIK